MSGKQPHIGAMPFRVEIDQQDQIISFALSGTLNTADMMAALDKGFLAATPGLRYAFLSDHRALEEPATSAQVSMVLQKISELRGVYEQSRWAIVVALTASYGMMRLLQVHAEKIGLEVEIFRDLAEANRWVRQPSKLSP